MIHTKKIIFTLASIIVIPLCHNLQASEESAISLFDLTRSMSEENYTKLLQENLKTRNLLQKSSGITHVNVLLSAERKVQEELYLQRKETNKSLALYGTCGGILGIGLYSFCKLYSNQDLVPHEMLLSGFIGGTAGIIVKSCDSDALPPKVQVPNSKRMPLLPEKE